jgi:hypothetical protein
MSGWIQTINAVAPIKASRLAVSGSVAISALSFLVLRAQERPTCLAPWDMQLPAKDIGMM